MTDLIRLLMVGHLEGAMALTGAESVTFSASSPVGEIVYSVSLHSEAAYTWLLEHGGEDKRGWYSDRAQRSASVVVTHNGRRWHVSAIMTRDEVAA